MPNALTALASSHFLIAIEISRSQLRWEFANTAAAVALLAIAFAAIALFIFRRRTGDKTLVYFGVFCVLYATRLLSLLPSFRALFNESGEFWHYDDWIITCTIIIPLGLFLYQVVDLRFKSLVRWLLVAQTVFAVFGIVAAVMGVRLTKLFAANNVMVLLVTIVPALIMLIARLRSRTGKRLPHEVRVLIVGLNIWLLFVVQTNLVGLGILSGHNIEFIGFLIFVTSLGYVAAYRTFANEEQLVAINKELEIARQIQASTLPQKIPAFAGLEIAVRYAPMSAVAGDFYDFISVDAKHVGILVADVTGHGVPAALIASMLKVAFAGQVEHARDPARVMSGLNQALSGKFEEHFVTAAYLFVDLERGVLQYSAAAHPPLLMGSRNGGDAQEIEENGLMLGMIPEAAYTSVEIPIRAGDRCLLYTDGLFETHNAAEQEYGKSRCREFLLGHRQLAATEFADALLADIAKFSGQDSAGAQEDDITLIVLDIT